MNTENKVEIPVIEEVIDTSINKNTFKKEKREQSLNRLRFLMLAGLMTSIAVHGLVRYWGKLTLSSLFIEKAMAQSIPANEQPIPTIYVKGVPIPDWSQVTFGNLKFSGSGSVEMPAPEIPIPGLKTSQQWVDGQSVSEVMELGDFEGTFGIENMDLQSIADIAGVDLGDLPLSTFETLQWQTLKDLVSAIPGLADLPIDSVPVLSDFVTNVTGNVLSGSIASVLESNPALDSAQLGKYISLDNYSLSSIPELQNTPLNQFSNWQSTTINGVPGLADVPFNNFAGVPVPDFSFIGMVDVPLNANEKNRFRSISGSTQEGFNVPCSSPCAHIELSGDGNLTGAQWISGKDQEVKGGFGFLKVIHGGKEPTGRHPYGPGFKQVITEVNEQNNPAIKTVMYFRKCHRGIPDLGCTPYFLGPISFANYKEKDQILLGVPLTIPSGKP